MFPSSSTEPEPLEITNTRLFAATPEALFAMFADPEELALWWGPDEFTNTVDELDLRPGGACRITMFGPDGKDWPNVSRFLEVVRPELIVFEHLEPVHRFTMTMTYTAEGEGTRLTWHMAFEPKPGNAQLKDFIACANEQNFDRLEARIAIRRLE